jgi:transglutaminase-like putative cysteine protease
MKPPRAERTTLLAIPDGIEGTRATLKIMGQLARDGKRSNIIRDLALQIVQKCPGKNWACEVNAIQEWVKRNIRYIRDIRGIETLHDPVTLLKLRQGDCDDQSILVAALLESIGHPAQFVALSFRPGEFAHVYTETLMGRRWVSVETTEPVKVGWTPPNVLRRMIENV